jgi:hypothetical protein
MTTWVAALKEWNARTGTKMYCIPKKGTAEFDAVKRIMDATKMGKDRVKDKVASVEEKVKKTRGRPKKVKAV